MDGEDGAVRRPSVPEVFRSLLERLDRFVPLPPGTTLFPRLRPGAGGLAPPGRPPPGPPHRTRRGRDRGRPHHLRHDRTPRSQPEGHRPAGDGGDPGRERELADPNVLPRDSPSRTRADGRDPSDVQERGLGRVPGEEGSHMAYYRPLRWTMANEAPEQESEEAVPVPPDPAQLQRELEDAKKRFEEGLTRLAYLQAGDADNPQRP